MKRYGAYTVIPVRDSEKWCVYDVIMGDAAAICPDQIVATRIAATLAEAIPELVLELLRAARPFADCLEQMPESGSDEEWVKHHLTVGDFRRLAAAAAALDG